MKQGKRVKHPDLSHDDDIPDIGMNDPLVREAYVNEETLEAIRRINRYILQLLHEDFARGGYLHTVCGLGEDSHEALKALLEQPWTDVEKHCLRLNSPLWRLADRAPCWRGLATSGAGLSQRDALILGSGFWPLPNDNHRSKV